MVKYPPSVAQVRRNWAPCATQTQGGGGMYTHHRRTGCTHSIPPFQRTSPMGSCACCANTQTVNTLTCIRHHSLRLMHQCAGHPQCTEPRGCQDHDTIDTDPPRAHRFRNVRSIHSLGAGHAAATITSISGRPTTTTISGRPKKVLACTSR
jgi:hypothetical protein